MKKYLFTILLAVLCVVSANAQVKIHDDGRVSFISLSNTGGVQIDTEGKTNFEPNITRYYSRQEYSKVHHALVRSWVIDNLDTYPYTPGDDFYVYGNGDIYGGSLYSANNEQRDGDQSQLIENASYIISSLNGYRSPSHEFDNVDPEGFLNNPNVNPDAIPGLLKDMSVNMVLGISAQELEVVLPEAVRHDPDGKVFISYQALIPVFIEGFKEQQKEIEQLRNVLEENGLLKPEKP